MCIRDRAKGVRAGLFASCDQWLVKRSLFVGWDGSVTVGVHGRDLVSSHPFWSTVIKIPLRPNHIGDFVDNFVAMVFQLRSYEICCGVESLKEAWKTDNESEIDLNHFSRVKIPKNLSVSFPRFFGEGFDFEAV